MTYVRVPNNLALIVESAIRISPLLITMASPALGLRTTRYLFNNLRRHPRYNPIQEGVVFLGFTAFYYHNLQWIRNGIMNWQLEHLLASAKGDAVRQLNDMIGDYLTTSSASASGLLADFPNKDPNLDASLLASTKRLLDSVESSHNFFNSPILNALSELNRIHMGIDANGNYILRFIPTDPSLATLVTPEDSPTTTAFNVATETATLIPTDNPQVPGVSSEVNSLLNSPVDTLFEFDLNQSSTPNTSNPGSPSLEDRNLFSTDSFEGKGKNKEI